MAMDIARMEISEPGSFRFKIEEVLDEQTIDWQLPFPDMDKSCEEACNNFKRTRRCYRGAYCPFRHTVGEKDTVCKHWLRGLCKKGDQCDFLHRFDLSRMPECYFFTTYGECNNDECIFLHIDPEKRRVECPWYARGFCRHGADCKNRHTRKAMCPKYLAGFCPDGPDCKMAHPPWEIPIETRGHDGAVTTTHRIPASRDPGAAAGREGGGGGGGGGSGRNIEDVTCHKCGQKGHFADRCPNPPAMPSVPPEVRAGGGPESTRVVRCPNDKVGLVIGRGGSTHRMLQESTGCKVHIPKQSEPGVDFREIGITGTEAQLDACESLLTEKIGDPSRSARRGHGDVPQPRPGEVQTVVQCPDEVVGKIIGKQGSTHRMLQESTGCQVSIPKTAEPGVSYREITLTGTQQQVDHCRQLIMEKLSQTRQPPGYGALGPGGPMHAMGPGGPMHGFAPPGPMHGPPSGMHGGMPPPQYGVPYGMHGGGPPVPPPHGGGYPGGPPPHGGYMMPPGHGGPPPPGGDPGPRKRSRDDDRDNRVVYDGF